MKENKTLTKRKMYSVDKENKHRIFFFLPTIMLSKKKLIDWDVYARGLFFGFLKWHVQINFFTKVQENNGDLEGFPKSAEEKERIYSNLLWMLSQQNLRLIASDSAKQRLEVFLRENDNLVRIIRNADPKNVYIQLIMYEYFKELPYFVKVDNKVTV